MMKKNPKLLMKGFKYDYKGILSDKEVDEALERMKLKPRKKLNWWGNIYEFIWRSIWKKEKRYGYVG